MKREILMAAALGLGGLGYTGAAAQLPGAFSYQGRLADGGLPASGTYMFQLALYDALEAGGQVGPTLTNTAVVTNGLFVLTPDFGSGVFAGDARWLELGVCTNGGAPFIILSPRQPVQPAPYALYAPLAGIAVSATTAALATNAVAAGTATTATTAASATAFTGPLAGDVTGPQTATAVERLRGQPLAATAPLAGQHLRYDGTQWQPSQVMLDQDTQGLLPLAAGGTGAGTPAAARLNLQAAASGANADITALSGLTTPLSVAQGGTGSGMQSFVDLTTDQVIAGRKLFQPSTDVPGVIVRQNTAGAGTADVLTVQNSLGTIDFVRVDSTGRLAWNGMAQGNVSGQMNGSFTGDGAGLTNLNATHLASGTLADARLMGAYSQTVRFTSPANQFTGDGHGLANLNASALAAGTLPEARLSGVYSQPLLFTSPANQLAGNGQNLVGLNASALAAGTLPGARLSGTYNNPLNFANAANQFQGMFQGNGANLFSLNADNLASGTVPGGRLSGTYPNALSLTSPANNLQGVFQGNGANLTNLNANAVTSGTLNDARLSANIPRLNAAAAFSATVSAPTVQAGTLNADINNLNSGAISYGLVLGQSSGEGVVSKRTAGGNQYGLDFLSAFTSRMSVENNGAIHFGAGTSFASYGDAQSSIYVLRGTSSGTGYTELLGAAGQRLVLPSNSMWTFRALVSGRSSAGEAAGYIFRGFIQNDNGTTWMREVANKEDIMEADSTWDVDVVANDTYNTLAISARGGTGDTVRWVAVVYTAEVKW
jgi:hypothetical protein